MAVKMSISSAKRMGVVATAYDTRGKKVIASASKKKINLTPKLKKRKFSFGVLKIKII